MKKIILASFVATLAVPFALSAADTPAAAPAAAVATADKKTELKDGSWIMTKADGSASWSSDGGKTWNVAPDGEHETKDGSKITIKGGKAHK